MPAGLTDARIIERLERLERDASLIAEPARSGERMGAAKLLMDRTGTEFLSAQRTVEAL